MGWRQNYQKKDDKVITEFASSVVGPGEAPIAVAASTDYKVLELVDKSEQPDFSDAISTLNKLLGAGTIILVVTEETLTLGYSTKAGLVRPEDLFTVTRDEVRVVGYGSGRLNTYLTLKAGPLVVQAFMGRWTPNRTRHSDLGAVAMALAGRGSRPAPPVSSPVPVSGE